MTTPLHVEIATTLEYLGSYGKGEPFWGVIVSVALAGDSGTLADEDFAKDVLRPWLWKDLGFELFALKQGDLQLKNPISCTMWTRPIRDTSALIDLQQSKNGSLDKVFERAVAASKTLPGAFSSQISGGAKPATSNLDPAMQQPPWPAVLAQISQLPYPIPHVLNISSFFQAKKPAEGDFVIAMPKFAARSQKLEPGTSGELIGDVAFSAVYTATPGTGVPVFCLCNRFPLPVVDPKPRTDKKNPPMRLDKNDPYVPIQQKSVYDTDWLAELLVRLSDPFDLGQRIIDAVSALLRESPPSLSLELLRQQVPLLRNAILLNLYQLANTGVEAAPDRGSVFDLALGTRDEKDSSLREAWRHELVSYQASVGQNLDAIRQFFGQLKEAAGCLAISAPQLTPAQPLEPGGSAANTESDAAIRALLAREIQQWETLQSALARDENLAALLLIQWRSVPPSANVTLEQRDKLVLAAQRQLTSVPLRRRYALANLGRGGAESYWSKTTKLSILSTDERSDIAQNFQTVLHKAVEAQLSNLNEKLRGALLQKLDAWAISYSSQYLVPAHEMSPKAGQTQPSLAAESPRPSVPHGISVQADSLYTFSKPEEEQTDVARQTAGFAVFMSDATQAKMWRCLSLAKVQFPDGTTRKDCNHEINGPVWDTPVVVPYPIQDEAGLRRVLITYNNGPLSSMNPAARLGPAGQTGQGGAPLISYRNAYPAKDTWAKLPPLVYGRSYTFLIARLSNSGALPQELARPNSPGELRHQEEDEKKSGTPPKDGKPGGPAQPGPDKAKLFAPTFLTDAYLPQVQYLRRVPVGALRIGTPKGSGREQASHANKQLRWGENAQGVSPRALEQAPATGSLVSQTNPELPKSVPVMIIKDRPYSLSVDRPGTDIETWDRWTAGPASLTALRKQVRSRVGQDASRQSQATDNIILEDPAVSPYLLAELVEEPTGKKSNNPVALASWAVKSPPSSIDDLRTSPIQVTVSPAPPGAQHASITGGAEINVNIPGGVVAYLYLSPVVRKADLDKFFPGVINGQTLATVNVDGLLASEDKTKLVALPPFVMAIEGVSEILPDVIQLRSQLAASIQGGRLKVTLTRDDSSGFKNVGRVEILRQRWHWDGRPFWTKDYRFPLDTFSEDGTPNPGSSAADAQERHKWLLQAFASRLDYEVLSTRWALQAQGKGTAFERGDDISSEPQATVYRFAVRVWNRYGPLITADQSRDSAAAGSNAKDFEGWRTIFVPCRLPVVPTAEEKGIQTNPGKSKLGQVPIPHIKLILPLTESAAADQNANNVSGLLVVLNGPWFTLGGVTEWLECEIARTQEPKSGAEVQEIGSDPTRSTTAVTEKYDLRPLIGPVGHTFDESDTLPRFVNTSFVIPGPAISRGAEPAPRADLGWFFGKVRFRRNIWVAGTRTPVSSAPTDSYWVQFLPKFVFQADSEEISVTTAIDLSADGSVLRLMKGNTAITIRRSADEQRTTRLFGILTAAIQDVTGRRTQEHYMGFFRYVDSSWKAETPIQGARNNLRFRIIEVEIPTDAGPDPTSLADLWERLFPVSNLNAAVENLRDSKARVVRVSRPIASSLPGGMQQ